MSTNGNTVQRLDGVILFHLSVGQFTPNQIASKIIHQFSHNVSAKFINFGVVEPISTIMLPASTEHVSDSVRSYSSYANSVDDKPPSHIRGLYPF